MKRSSSGAARNAPSSTFLPNSRPFGPGGPAGGSGFGFGRSGSITAPVSQAGVTATRHGPACTWRLGLAPLHEPVAVRERPLLDVGGHAGAVQATLDLVPHVVAHPARAGRQAVRHAQGV